MSLCLATIPSSAGDEVERDATRHPRTRAGSPVPDRRYRTCDGSTDATVFCRIRRCCLTLRHQNRRSTNLSQNMHLRLRQNSVASAYPRHRVGPQRPAQRARRRKRTPTVTCNGQGPLLPRLRSNPLPLWKRSLGSESLRGRGPAGAHSKMPHPCPYSTHGRASTDPRAEDRA